MRRGYPNFGTVLHPGGRWTGVMEVVSRAGPVSLAQASLHTSLASGQASRQFAGVSDNASLRKSGGFNLSSTLEPTSSFARPRGYD